jgi:hypothetical protein
MKAFWKCLIKWIATLTIVSIIFGSIRKIAMAQIFVFTLMAIDDVGAGGIKSHIFARMLDFRSLSIDIQKDCRPTETRRANLRISLDVLATEIVKGKWLLSFLRAMTIDCNHARSANFLWWDKTRDAIHRFTYTISL